MLLPLIILALFSVFLGAPQIGLAGYLGFEEDKASHHAALIWGTIAASVGMIGGYMVYRNADTDPLPAKLGVLSRWMRDRFYFDELYAFLNHWTQETLSYASNWFDRWIIAGLGVKGTSGAIDVTGCLVRLFQSGNLQTYALLTVIGLLSILAWILF